MRKRRNRVYRRIAVALTVALLAGQSHAFVLAEEDAGGAPQTEITGEADTSTSDNSNVADGGNADNGSGGNAGGTEQGGSNSGVDGQIPDDNGNQGDQQGDGDGQDRCICETKCVEDAVNPDCPVCASDYAACVGKADDEGNNGSENGGQENLDGSAESIADGQKCICETVCTEENVNMDCPVCAADYANCAKKAGEGVSSSVDAALPEMVPASVLDEEAGIDALADEGVEAYAVGDTFTYAYEGQTLRYTVIKEDGDTREVEVAQQSRGSVGNRVVIPSTIPISGETYRVTGIGENAFILQSLTSVEIPDSVTSIGEFAFFECANLSSIEIPDSMISIGPKAFYSCRGLESVEIPNSVTSIGEETFRDCTSLTGVEIPNSVTSIEGGAFFGCRSLESVKMPESMTSIERDTFGHCSSLKSIEIPEDVTSIGRAAFEYCSSLESVEIPKGVTSIEDITFIGCSSLKSVEIPKGVTSIGDAAFRSCSNLTDITIPEDVTSIGVNAFYACDKLDALKITILSDGRFQFPEVKADSWTGQKTAFSGIPNDRYIRFVDENGEELTGERYENAKAAFEEAAKNDNDPTDNPDDGKWYGWSLEKSSEVKDTHKVTLTVQKDDAPWPDHDRTFALTKDGGTTLVTNLGAVEAGDYEIVDATDSGNKLKTGVVVKVADTDASATVEYYTVAFCYLDDDGNEQTYGDSTDWKPQTILKTVGRVTKPATNPTKADHTFDKWVTASNGETAFAFETTPITEKDTKIYAKWTENTVTTYHTVTFYDGTTPYGADTPQKPQSVADGQTADKPEDPQKAGWEFAGWKTKTADGGSTDYNFDTPVTGDTDIYASWVKKTVTDPLRIRATATEGGTIDPEGEIIVSKGGERTFTITPDEGNKIKAVTVDDEDVTADLKETRARVQAGARYYTFTNIVKDHTIHAEFEKDGNGGGDNPNPNPKPDPDGESGGFGGEPKDHSSSDVQNNAGTEQVIMVSETSSPQAENSAPITSGAKQSPSAQAANGREPKTGDASYLEVYATLAMIAGLTYLLLYVMEESRGMSEREKEAFVAAFIRWGKKGGTFRKCCAMAAIFCLLAYYHIIGKNVGENALRKKHLGQAF